MIHTKLISKVLLICLGVLLVLFLMYQLCGISNEDTIFQCARVYELLNGVKLSSGSFLKGTYAADGTGYKIFHVTRKDGADAFLFVKVKYVQDAGADYHRVGPGCKILQIHMQDSLGGY